MRLAVSNIAWSRDNDAAVAALLRTFGVTGVELAPTVVWPDPLSISPVDVRAYRDWWDGEGFTVVALQALLFGHPELVLFGGPEAREGMLQHLTGMIALGAQLGAQTLVFGSPRNRSVGELPADHAQAIAVEFFREIGRRATEHGVAVCIEPNPAAYHCDFVTTVAEGVALVEAVSSAGFGLHIDAGAMAINGEAIEASLALAAKSMRHFHASEPFLEPLGLGTTPHERCADALVQLGYPYWVSMEMRAPAPAADALHNPLKVLQARYGA